MSDNLIHYRPVGITGDPMTFTLKDANDAPVSQVGWTAHMIIVRHPDTRTTMFTAAVTIDPDQVTNPGKGSYQFQSSDVDTIGEFPFFFQCLDPLSQPRQFPIDDPEGDSAYGTLVVY